jgi:LPS sulfotransferase NodH
MWGTLDQLIVKLGTIYPDVAGQDLSLLTRAFGRPRFIYLTRDDRAGQAVSWARAEQTQFWQEGDRALPGIAPRFDFDQIHELVRTIEAHDAAWWQWFQRVGVSPHVVHYEELARDPVGCTQQILTFLGLETGPGRSIRSERKRQADGINREWLNRYRAAVSRP